MPTRVTITERYWSVCYALGVFPYPCRRTRTVTKWRYFFSRLKEHRYGVVCFLDGCEDGLRYTWFAPCFNVFGTEVFYNKEMFFSTPRNRDGTCS